MVQKALGKNELIEKNGLIYKRSHIAEVVKTEEQGYSGSGSATAPDMQAMQDFVGVEQWAVFVEKVPTAHNLSACLKR